MTSLDDVMEVKAFVKRYPDLGKSQKALYWDLWNSAHNGLDKHGAILRKGRRVFIVVPKYRDWLFNKEAQP